MERVFVFVEFTEASEIEYLTRALVEDNYGFLRIAVWLNDHWCDEGCFCYAGGINGKIDNIKKYCKLS